MNGTDAKIRAFERHSFYMIPSNFLLSSSGDVVKLSGGLTQSGSFLRGFERISHIPDLFRNGGEGGAGVGPAGCATDVHSPVGGVELGPPIVGRSVVRPT